MFRQKNAEYGDAIAETGVLGACVALIGDVGRLKQMVLNGTTHGRDRKGNLEDKLRDIAVQAVIGLMMLREENWEGK